MHLCFRLRKDVERAAPLFRLDSDEMPPVTVGDSGS